eukprot:TRINITY_DN73945_c0_g1_i1.p1 TRINITY_DN73945_c0_g1~~TRINITY_DN73945_c0_g1_i1.p1  ORF type:complete len:628 (-),score=69.14 TRINITY_DN73945_c0_g1_i1:163-2046(-)
MRFEMQGRLLAPQGSERFRRGGELDLSTGITRSRQCTDVGMCLLFVISLAGVIVVSLQIGPTDYSVLRNFSAGHNWKGDRCGIDSRVSKFPLTYFTFPEGYDPNATADKVDVLKNVKPVCTDACPQGSNETAAYQRLAKHCDQETVVHGFCTWYGGKTIRLSGYCIDLNLFATDVPIESAIGDVYASKNLILLCFVLSILVGFLWLFFIRWSSGLVICLTLFGMLAVLGLVGMGVFFNADNLSSRFGWEESHTRGLAYGIWGLDGVLLLCVLCSVCQIRTASSILKTAALFLVDVKSAMLQPLFSALIQILVLCVYSFLFVRAAGISLEHRQPADGGACFWNTKVIDPFCIAYKHSVESTSTFLFFFFMYAWTASYVHAISMFVTAYATGVWFFSPIVEGHKVLPDGNTFCDFKLLCRAGCASLKHLGSFAFGSLILGTCQTISALSRCISSSGADDNPVGACVCACTKCIARCLEDCVRFVSDNAYVQMALVGRNFCTSCTIGIGMVRRHPALYILVDRFSVLIRLIGPFAVGGIIGPLAWLLLTRPEQPNMLISTPLTSPMLPAVVVGFIAWGVGSVMMHPYYVVSKAVMHCFAADKEMDEHDGGSGFMPHTPPPLQSLLRNIAT